MLVLYGSQTGCSKDVAERVGRDAEDRYISSRVASMDEYDVSALPNEPLVIFLCSTTGDGDVPDSMLMFWRFLLRRDLSSQSLSSVKYVVFGLGDSSYAHFNVVARKLQARLKQLGGIEFHPLVLGDDQSPNGLAGDVDVWLTSLWTNVLQMYPLPNGVELDTTPKLPGLKYSLTSVVPNNTNTNTNTTSLSTVPLPSQFYRPGKSIVPQAESTGSTAPTTACSPPIFCAVVQNDRMTSLEWHQNVRHIVLRPLSNNITLKYSAGDIAVVYPTNVFNVEQFAATMGYDPDAMFCLASTTATASTLPLFPTPCTIRYALQYYLNILGVPTRRAVELLSFYCTNSEERDKFIEIGRSTEGADLYHSYLKREKRSYVELFDDFQSCRPSFLQLINIIPLLQPREFSIVSSPNVHGRDVHLAVAVVEFTSYYKRQRHGVCTQWLSTLLPPTDAQIPLFIKRGRINPIPVHVPVLLIGPGTGIAPIMSLLYDRDAVRRQEMHGQPRHGGEGGEDGESGEGGEGGGSGSGSGTSKVKDLIFFGCRHESKDYIFEKELNKLCANAKQMKLCVAFSRDAPPNKVYVQHLIGQHTDEVWSIIDPKQGNGKIIISGSSQSMPRDVMKVIGRIVQLHGNMTEIQANKFLRVMKNRGRCVIECW